MSATRGPALRGAVRRDVVRLGADRAGERVADDVVVEEPLEIRVAGEALAVTMRTPGHDRQLALGFLLAEGVIASAGDVGSVYHCGRPGDEGYGNVLDVVPAGGARVELERVEASRRGTLTTAACGVCGRRTVDDLLARCGPLADGGAWSARAIAAAVDAMRAAQPVFARTGGVHAAGAFDATGALVAVFEDVGRHNAVDKVVGQLLLDGRVPARGLGLAVSGRASFEIVQKAVAAGIALVASVSAASSLAVDLADKTGVALLGFVRGDRATVYTGADRIV